MRAARTADRTLSSHLTRETRGLRQKVVAFREAPGLACRCPVVSDSALAVSREFKQMCTNSVKTVMTRETGISFEIIQQFQSLCCAVHHRCRDRVIQRDHGVAGHASEQIVQRQDMRPIRVVGSIRFVMNGGDGGLQLVWADRALG